jgi:hypothetical protein
LSRAAWGNSLWRLSSLLESWTYRRGRLRPTQQRILGLLLQRQVSTLFGRRHGLDRIASYEAFQERVPISSYEDLLPFLAKPQALSPQKVRVWEPTGGSSGGSKWIPWTAGLQQEFRRAVAVWIWHLFQQHPEVMRGRSYWQLTPKAEISEPLWLRDQSTGFASDGEYLGPLGKWLERSVLISVEQGPDLWRRTVQALKQAPDLRLISCWSPSFLVCLQQRFLDYEGRWEPQRWWPNLRLLSCWTQGPSAIYLPRLRELFPGVAIQPKGLLSTEAVVTVPVGSQHPLAYRSHFFELGSGAETIPSWQWEAGLEGTVIVTTGAGLTRYSTGDRVRVTGHLGGIPCLEFLGREGVSDQRGEKLAFAFLEPLLDKLGGFAMLAFENDGYVLFTDEALPPSERLAQAKQLQNELLANYTYRDCQHLGQLQPLKAFLIAGDALGQYSRVCSDRLGQPAAKPLRFHPHQGWSQAFQGRFL